MLIKGFTYFCGGLLVKLLNFIVIEYAWVSGENWVDVQLFSPIISSREGVGVGFKLCIQIDQANFMS